LRVASHSRSEESGGRRHQRPAPGPQDDRVQEHYIPVLSTALVA